MEGPSDHLFGKLDVIDDLSPRGGAINMALDEVLMIGLTDTPLLRVYRWTRPTVSFGFFDPWQTVVAEHPSGDLVRRWTGGGIVEHGEDTTYSLLMPRATPLTNLRAGESYRLIHAALRRALLQMHWGDPTLDDGSNSVGPATTRACFANSVRYDLLSHGRKISGAAQRRTRLGLLHQGSLRRTDHLPTDADELARVLPSVLSRQVHPRLLREEEVMVASHLSAEKYATDAWLKRV